jgi:hypothetical protein
VISATIRAFSKFNDEQRTKFALSDLDEAILTAI